MLKSLKKRDDGYELFEVPSIDHLDLSTLVPMIDRAWRADYQDESRLDFSEAVLRKIMAGNAWTAVLVCSNQGEPVGFELALERTLRVRDQTLRAYYVSVLTVSAEHRRLGLGHLVLSGINQLVFEKHRADVIVSTFHEGHAGSPAVQSTFDRIPDWGVSRFHQAPIYSRRLDGAILSQAPSIDFLQLEAQPDHDAKLIAGPLSHGDLSPPSFSHLDALIRSEYDISFALDRSLSTQYLNADNPASGLFYYRLGEGRFCLLGWNILPMAIQERSLRPIGQLQLALAPDCTENQIEHAITHLAHFLAKRDCFAMTLVDMDMVPTSVLERLGFVASEDRITFAARGPKQAIEVFEGAAPPLFLDFT